MSQFSGAVKITDLSDFIAPSQACIVSLEPHNRVDAPLNKSPEDGLVKLQQGGKRAWSQTLPRKSEKEPVKISLQDCLACSGCVTSAETVLLEHQSTDVFDAKLQDASTAVVVTLSGQSVASLAVAHGLTAAETAKKLSAAFKKIGVKAVLDATTGRDIALIEAAEEFIARFRECQDSTGQDGVAAECERVHSANGCSTSGRNARLSSNSRKLPMLASACPGWVCYAEKTHGEYALPFISTTKSPQAVMGTLVKRFWAGQNGLQPSAVYHCAVMPCYDKKLEAARDDFLVPGTDVPETDSVLTTVEVQQLLDRRSLDLTSLPEEALQGLTGKQQNSLSGFPGGSGGYLEYIYRVAAERLCSTRIANGPLHLQSLRNTDFQEITLKFFEMQADGRAVLRFALAYGFRNIQTLLRKLKHGTSPYDYVEVMACPSACLNGGGQLRAAGESTQELIARLETTYHSSEVEWRRPEDNPVVKQIYAGWVGDKAYSENAISLFHTQYHKRSQNVTAAIKDW